MMIPTHTKKAIRRIRQQIATFETSTSVSNPVTIALGFGQLSESGDSRDKIIISLAEQMEKLQSKVDQISSQLAVERVGNALASPSGNALRPSSWNAFAAVLGKPNTDVDADSLADVLARHLKND
jgi:hypothetical protein